MKKTFVGAAFAAAFGLAACGGDMPASHVSTGVPGAALAAAATSSLGVSVFCSSAGHGHLDCEATVDGGTAPYSFAWSPTPVFVSSAGTEAVIPCNVGHVGTASVTVTDANSETASASGSAFCGIAQ
jgi:hypothetical protein